MSDDFRAPLYRGYVSTFKGSPSKGEGAYAWWDYKYLPLLGGIRRDTPILEVGCGSGALLEYLGRRGFSNARGIDISPEQVDLARARGVDARLGDALTMLSEEHETFGVIVGVDVLEHFTMHELMRLTPLLYSALQPGGRLLVQTANGAGLLPGQVIHGDLTHQTIFTPESLAQLLRNVAFCTLSFYETGPIPLRLRGRLDLALWSAIKGLANAVRYVETGKRQAIWTENFICLAIKGG
jgi:2-polyprenyl-3-methyl-5-hydroxy-6-metoxy-1,4-benzoquinol methylase